MPLPKWKAFLPVSNVRLLNINYGHNKAVVDCINEGILADVLSKNRAEVLNLLIYEYDEKKQREIEREEGKAEGKAEDIIDLLEELGEVSDELRARIFKETDLDVLRKWHKAAARAETLDEFVEKL